MVRMKGTSRESSAFFSMLTTLMLVLIWMFGAGFRMSQKRSADMLEMDTLTLIIAVSRESISASGI